MEFCIYPSCTNNVDAWMNLTWCCNYDSCSCRTDNYGRCVCFHHYRKLASIHMNSMDGTTFEKPTSDCNIYTNLQSEINISLVQRLAVSDTDTLIVFTDGNCISIGKGKFGNHFFVPFKDMYYKCSILNITQYEQYTYRPVLDSLNVDADMYINRLPRDITNIIRIYL